MTRRKFSSDLAHASREQVEHISGLKKGDDDGEITFVLSHNALSSPVYVRLVAMDVDEYPQGLGFVAFTIEESVSSEVSEVLDNVPNFSQGKSILDTLVMISKKLNTGLDSSYDDNDTDVEMTDVDQDEEDEEDNDYDYDDTAFGFDFAGDSVPQSLDTPNSPPKITSRLIDDLQKAKEAGFKISLLSHAAKNETSCIFSLSLPVAHLGINEDTLEAWEVSAFDYIVLLYKYDAGYPCVETFTNLPSGHSNSMHFSFGKCASFKPTLSSALIAFSPKFNTAKGRSAEEGLASGNSRDAAFCSMPISDSMDNFMNKELAKLLKIRLNYGVSWDGAKDMLEDLTKDGHLRGFNSKQSNLDPNRSRTSHSLNDNDAQVSTTTRESLNKDYVRHNPRAPGPLPCEELSLPLIAMQFALRYFVKSTQYCLVCHRKTEPGFTALKPYVCDYPLCLYQYMALGLGPSIEHDIIARPYIVDLLVSFCAAALESGRIREWPQGLAIKVPILNRVLTPTPTMPMTMASWSTRKSQQSTQAAKDAETQITSTPILVWAQISAGKFNVDCSQKLELRPGDMIILAKPALSGNGQNVDMHHCRVKSVNTIHDDDGNIGGKVFEFDHIMSIQKLLNKTGPARHRSNEPSASAYEIDYSSKGRIDDEEGDAELYLYNYDLDKLSAAYQREALMILVQTIPPIRHLRDFLLSHRGSPLTDYKMISKSALALLRWIVASNRSFIVQIDQPVDLDIGGIKATESRQRERLVGLSDDWMQFRFAQGSPEKENRFKQELEKEATTQHPTLFAWHGSQLGNWHSIIRTGLDFKDTVNGRAFGHGVYFARDFETSMHYCNKLVVSTWTGSELKLSAAMSLCEIINRPAKFKSISPYYVVDEVNWIQCRYLVIQRKHASTQEATPAPKPEYISQHPQWKVLGIGKIEVDVPAAALPRWRQKSTVTGSLPSQPIVLVDDSGEDEPDDFDYIIDLQKGEEADDDDTKTVTLHLEPHIDPDKTPFTPATLDMESLPQLPAPSWASDQGRQVIGKELSKLQKLQAKTPLHELGWYIDFENITNMFQWIVQLHSFDKSLPLARDMERAGVDSVVLEIRFGRQFPLSPPFIRVIRPRFLPFSQRGGGHITAGGAMCMELLTNSGWSPVSSMEGVLLQVRVAMCNLQPFPARLARQEKGQPAGGSDYGVFEAVEAYKRSAAAHGWQVPPDLDMTANAQ
ncbi:polymerase [Colletotrichum orchidophilum]|uniref:Polymerase n=1 Tax=Colletotrichum orchidophilum TaxID=1209926 RepID=A0A1G4BCY1_9PEZI|nr:polymerase [Colletotrichum orchidophilum]OHE99217.1 polymerase [Colletotrichum orchidophilum]